jgi:antitoxin HicB
MARPIKPVYIRAFLAFRACKEGEMTPINRFELTKLPEEEGGGWLIIFPDLPGCMSDGATIEEAVANGGDAEKEWLAANKRWGETSEKSGKLSIRLPKSLHRQLSYRAKNEEVSVNTLIVSYLQSFFPSV